MKKLYSLIAVMLMAVVSAFAGVTVNVNVGDVCSVGYTDSETQSYVTKTLAAGDNTLDVAAGVGLSFQLANTSSTDYVFTSIKQGETSITLSSATSAYITAVADATYTITVKSQAEARDAKCTIKVDDPTKVQVRTSATYRTIELTAGDNEVSFISGLESPLQIQSSTYGKSLYSISVNGTAQTVSQYNSVNVTNGDVVELKANYPDIKYKLTFSYSEGAEGFITGVSVDDVAVEDFSNGVDVQAGSTVSITGNTSDYKYESMTIGGTAVSYFYGSTSFTMLSDTEVAVNAHKYGELSFTVNVDDPANFILYKGYSYNGVPYTLVAGKNELKISENSATIQFKANSGCYFTSIKVGDEEKYYSGSSETNITVTEGMVITVTTGKIVRDKNVTVYVNDKSLAATYFSFTRSDRSSVDIATGNNTVAFCDNDLPFSFSAYGHETCNVYVNDVLTSPLYAGSTSYQFNTINDNDVIKIMFNETTGVEDIAADANAVFNVYNLQGVCVARGVSNLNNLPAGIYIAAGKKVVVKK
jgi:hypothetical protein